MYTHSDVGCYADGALGDKHLREVLSNMVPELAEDLNADNDDDSAFIEALEVLQLLTDPGLIWMLEAGDLLLVEEGQE